jgi:hypothetical protein
MWIKRRVGEGGAATYHVQIVDQPHHIVALKAPHTLDVLLPTKYVDELVAKVG